MKPNYLPITHPLQTSTKHTSQTQEQPAAAGIGLQVLSSEPVRPISLLNLPCHLLDKGSLSGTEAMRHYFQCVWLVNINSCLTE